MSNRFAASALLYGAPGVVPFPDLTRTDLLLCIGANPLVSHGSLLTAPRIKDRLHAIVARGGRVVVVDPRRSETARQFEHVPVQPDSDAFLLLSLLHVVFAEGLEDREAIRAQAVGAGALRSIARDFPPEATAARTGVDPGTVRELARAVATAGSAAVYGRTGTCLGRFGTLVAYLMDALTLVTGNLDRPGGMVFNRPPVSLDDLAEKVGMGYDTARSRIGGFPDVLGAMPASLIPEEITTPGPGALRALFVSAGNPVLSVPNGPAMAAALEQLDLVVSLDLYVTETNRHADYVLPATTFLEREDLPAALLGFYVQPFVQWTEAVVAPRGEARQEWEVIEDLSKRIGVVPNPLPLARRLRLRVKPRLMIEALLRSGPRRIGLRDLRAKPHGLVLDEHVPTGLLREKVRHPDRRVRLDARRVLADVERLAAAPAASEEFPFKLVGLRELRSHNSWMHNAPLLMRGERVHAARAHPDDLAACGAEHGDLVRVVSKDGAIEVPVIATDEMARGVVAVPHGWGHHGGWQIANAAGGVNTNVLAGNAVEDLEPLAGMAFLNGIPIRLEAVVAPERRAFASTLEA